MDVPGCIALLLQTRLKHDLRSFWAQIQRPGVISVPIVLPQVGATDRPAPKKPAMNKKKRPSRVWISLGI